MTPYSFKAVLVETPHLDEINAYPSNKPNIKVMSRNTLGRIATERAWKIGFYLQANSNLLILAPLQDFTTIAVGPEVSKEDFHLEKSD